MSIPIKKEKEILKIEKSNIIVAKALEYLQKHTTSGMTLAEVNKMGEAFIKGLGGRPVFKGLYGFPAGVCTSLNEVIIHGIPDAQILKEGDILGLDIGVELDGWFGDAAITIPIGNISTTHKNLIQSSKDSLMHAVGTMQAGMRFKELSDIIEKKILSDGFVPLRGFCGHGIGYKPHEEPEIPNYIAGGKIKAGPKIKNGMVFCVEPMLCQKDGNANILKDDWSVVSKDGLYGSHYEHCIAVINDKAEILSHV